MELQELLLNHLDKLVRNGKVSYEQSLEHFLLCLNAVVEDAGSKLLDQAYRIFYQILLLPLETKDRKQIITDKTYLQVYDSVRIDKNEDI